MTAKCPDSLGDLAIVRGDTVQGYQGDSVYYVRFAVVMEAIVVPPVAARGAVHARGFGRVVVSAMLLYGGLQRRVARRLAANSSQ